MKVLLTLFSLFFIAQISFAQEKPKAELVDEISPTNCCDMDSRTYNLINAIKNDSESKGYIILFYSNKTLGKALYFERTISSSLFSSKIKNIKIIRKKSEDGFKTQFWFVPNGAEIPFSLDDEVDFAGLFSNKSRLFALSYGELCDEKGQEKQLAEIFSASQNLRGHLVIYAKTKANFLKRQRLFQKEFSDIYQVPKNKIKYFYVNNENEYEEYWLVPKRRKT